MLRLNIGDNVDKINTYLKLGGGQGANGYMASQGRVIKKPEETTFKKLNVRHMQNFSIVCKST